MMKYVPSSELQRDTEQNLNNIQRHIEWLRKSAPYRYLKVKDEHGETKPTTLNIRELL